MMDQNRTTSNQEKRAAERISQDLLRKATTSKYRFESERYEFRDIIGRGGMGVVLNARDKLLNRDVAVKFLKPELNEIEEARNIFLSEARSMAVLSHTNLISVYDVGVVEDHVMMVVELVEGEDLYKYMHRTTPPVPLSYEEVLRVGIQLCRVVYYMHKQGMIHRDLKPANVILQKDGSIKLIDFGLTRALDDIAIRQTQVRGTPAYMSPEQQDGKELMVMSDIYQIGVTLFELLTTELPFKHQMHSANAERVLSVDEFDPSIPEDITRCLIKAMQFDPADRQQTAKELMEELQASYARLSQPLLSEVQQQQATAPISHVGVLERTTQQPLNQPAETPSQMGAQPKKSGLPLLIISLLVLGIGIGLIAASQMKNKVEQPTIANKLTVQAPAAISAGEKQSPKPVDVKVEPKPAPKKVAPVSEPVAPTPDVANEAPKDKVAPAPDVTKEPSVDAPPVAKVTPKPSTAKKKAKRTYRASKPKSAKATPASKKPKSELMPKSNKPSLFEKGAKPAKTKTSGNKPSLFTP